MLATEVHRWFISDCNGASTTIGTKMGSGGCMRFTGGRFTLPCVFARSGVPFSSTRTSRSSATTKRRPTGSARSSLPRTSWHRRRPPWCGRSVSGLAHGLCGWTSTGRRFASGTTTPGWSYRSRGTRAGLPSALSPRGRSTVGRPLTSCRCI